MSNAYTGPDNDKPDLGSVAIRVYRPTGTTTTVSGPAPKTTTTRYDTSQLIAAQRDFAAMSEDGNSGPPSPFDGPLQPVWVNKTVTTPGNQYNVTTGIFANAIEIDHFLSYEYFEIYTTPCDGWSFTLSGDELSADQRAALVPGAKVEVTIDDNPQTTGYIDKIKVASHRSGGTIVTIEGRHWLAPAIDAHVDPQTRFVPSMSLLDVLNAIFTPFGMAVVSTDNVANRNAIKGATFGAPTTKKGRTPKSFILHQEKPYPNEGAFQFASRISQRFGLWIRPAAEFGTLIVGEPDYDQQPSYTIHHKTDENSSYNNVLESDVAWDREQQPSIIFGSGVGSGGDFAKSTLRAYIVNPLVASSPTAMQALIAKYTGIVQVPLDAVTLPSGVGNVPIPDPTSRPLYLYDSESHTQEQLEAYLRRELSLRMRKALTAKYTIEGHRIAGVNLAVDSLVSVDDDRAPLQTDMWILSRRFSKTMGSGTTTVIETILPGTMVFGPGGTQ
jgi:prophage tail gpP-like protein